MTTPDTWDAPLSAPLHRLRYVVAHCEPTGLDPNTDGVFDVALVRFEQGEAIARFASLLNPRCAIPPALAVACSISNLDVADQPTLGDLMPELRAFAGADLIVAHDAAIARTFLSRITDRTDWLSLIELASHAWPLALIDDYSARGLLRYADLEEHPAPDDLPLKRAEGEAVAVGILMHAALENLELAGYQQWDELQRLMGGRTPVSRFWFGQSHRAPLHEIPEHYLRWVLDDAARPPRLRTLHVDPSTLYAIRVHLAAYRSQNFLSRDVGKRGGECRNPAIWAKRHGRILLPLQPAQE